MINELPKADINYIDFLSNIKPIIPNLTKIIFPENVFINRKVNCNSAFGLTPKKAELAIKILNNYV